MFTKPIMSKQSDIVCFILIAVVLSWDITYLGRETAIWSREVLFIFHITNIDFFSNSSAANKPYRVDEINTAAVAGEHVFGMFSARWEELCPKDDNTSSNNNKKRENIHGEIRTIQMACRRCLHQTAMSTNHRHAGITGSDDIDVIPDWGLCWLRRHAIRDQSMSHFSSSKTATVWRCSTSTSRRVVDVIASSHRPMHNAAAFLHVEISRRARIASMHTYTGSQLRGWSSLIRCHG